MNKKAQEYGLWCLGKCVFTFHSIFQVLEVNKYCTHNIFAQIIEKLRCTCTHVVPDCLVWCSSLFLFNLRGYWLFGLVLLTYFCLTYVVTDGLVWCATLFLFNPRGSCWFGLVWCNSLFCLTHVVTDGLVWCASCLCCECERARCLACSWELWDPREPKQR